MPRRPTYLSKEFAAKCAALEGTRIKVESLLDSQFLERPDVEAVYAGLFIDAFTEFESLIERLCLGLFDGSLRSAVQPATPLLRVKPASQSRAVLFDGDNYVDWLPLEDRAIPRAKRFLSQGGPFVNLSSAERGTLKNAHLLRNALAHKSDAATRKFLLSINQQALLPHEKTPSGYLRTIPQGGRGPTQFSLILGSLGLVAKKLCL
jgi:hypothetical protein